MDPKLQQLLMLLSGAQQGGLNGGQMQATAPAANQMRLSGGINTAANASANSAAKQASPGDNTTTTTTTGDYVDPYDHGFNPGFDPHDPRTGGDGKNDGKGGKGDPGKDDPNPEPDLSDIMQQWRNAVDQGPSGYTNAMRQNLGMSTAPYNMGDRSGMASFMNLFMGNGGNNNGNHGNNGHNIGGPGSEGPGFRWMGDHNGNHGGIDRGGPGSEGPGFRWRGGDNGGNGGNGGGNDGGMHPLMPARPLGPSIGHNTNPQYRGGPGSEGPGFRWMGDKNGGGNGGWPGRPV
jgi:hypothetical protein